LSAAEIHGAPHQAPQIFQVATSRHVRSRRVGRTQFQFLTRSAIRGVPIIERATRSGHARVSSRETTILDLASDIGFGGGIDNVATVIVQLAEGGLDVRMLADLSDRFPVASGRRVGWILDEFTDQCDLAPLSRALGRRAVAVSLLDSTGPIVGVTNNRWDVRVNRDVEQES
jgi:predicted transcriptional regulator of viral defense system